MMATYVTEILKVSFSLVLLFDTYAILVRKGQAYQKSQYNLLRSNKQTNKHKLLVHILEESRVRSKCSTGSLHILGLLSRALVSGPNSTWWPMVQTQQKRASPSSSIQESPGIPTIKWILVHILVLTLLSCPLLSSHSIAVPWWLHLQL